MKAGRLLLAEFHAFVARHETFGFESTLSGTTHVRQLKQAKRQGFRLYLHYLWLPNPAIARVRERVKMGGHDVPESDIRRRFTRSLPHLVHDYARVADRWAVWDNQTSPPRLLAESETCSTSQLRGNAVKIFLLRVESDIGSRPATLVGAVAAARSLPADALPVGNSALAARV